MCVCLRRYLWPESDSESELDSELEEDDVTKNVVLELVLAEDQRL